MRKLQLAIWTGRLKRASNILEKLTVYLLLIGMGFLIFQNYQTSRQSLEVSKQTQAQLEEFISEQFNKHDRKMQKTLSCFAKLFHRESAVITNLEKCLIKNKPVVQPNIINEGDTFVQPSEMIIQPESPSDKGKKNK